MMFLKVKKTGYSYVKLLGEEIDSFAELRINYNRGRYCVITDPYMCSHRYFPAINLPINQKC